MSWTLRGENRQSRRSRSARGRWSTLPGWGHPRFRRGTASAPACPVTSLLHPLRPASPPRGCERCRSPAAPIEAPAVFGFTGCPQAVSGMPSRARGIACCKGTFGAPCINVSTCYLLPRYRGIGSSSGRGVGLGAKERELRPDRRAPLNGGGPRRRRPR